MPEPLRAAMRSARDTDGLPNQQWRGVSETPTNNLLALRFHGYGRGGLYRAVIDQANLARSGGLFGWRRKPPAERGRPQPGKLVDLLAAQGHERFGRK
jgi:hypothetical protein